MAHHSQFYPHDAGSGIQQAGSGGRIAAWLRGVLPQPQCGARRFSIRHGPGSVRSRVPWFAPLHSMAPLQPRGRLGGSRCGPCHPMSSLSIPSRPGCPPASHHSPTLPSIHLSTYPPALPAPLGNYPPPPGFSARAPSIQSPSSPHTSYRAYPTSPACCAQPVRGTHAWFPEDAALHRAIWGRIHGVVARHGYGEVRPPVLEAAALFRRTLGAASDVVSKEMFAFTDADGTEVCLRPEGTAGKRGVAVAY